MRHISSGDFGKLRSLLQHPPKASIYDQLIDLFQGYSPTIQEEVMLPYARDYLASWPEALRVWRPSWTRRFIRATPVPVAGLAQEVIINNRNIYQRDPQSFDIHVRYMKDVRTLMLENEPRLTCDYFRSFIQQELFATLHTLELAWMDIEASEYDNLFEAYDNRRLKTLILGYATSSSATLDHVLDPEHMPMLEHLNPGLVTPRNIHAFKRQSVAPTLKRLRLASMEEQEALRLHMPWSAQVETLSMPIYRSYNQALVGIPSAVTFVEDAIREHDWSGLKTLKLQGRLNAGLIDALAQNDTIRNLKSLIIDIRPHDEIDPILQSAHFSDALKQNIAQQERILR